MRTDNLAALEGITLRDLEFTLDRHTRERVRVDKYTAFSWSVSRHALFEQCRRAYYLQYYGARRVREAKNRLVSAIWWLKQVTPLRMWIGTVVHQVAADAVRAVRDGREVGRDALVTRALQTYRAGVKASLRGAKHDGMWRVLFEHIYPAATPSIDRDEAETLVVDLAQVLHESEAYAFLRSLPPEAIREIDPPFQSFRLEGVPKLGKVQVFAIPDVLVQHAGKVHIIDWKTGGTEHEDLRWQAGVYRLYAHRAYRTAGEDIHCVLADLGTGGENVEPRGGVPGVEEAEEFAHVSIYNMVSLMESVEHNTVSIRGFPMTDNLATCRWCGFRRACWRHEVTYD